jgi:16S rRNA processing protein RimM
MILLRMDDAGTWDEMAMVGRVARTHGISGHLIVDLETDFPEQRFYAGATLHVHRSGQTEQLIVTNVRMHQGRPIVGFDGIETMTQAEEFLGLELRVPETELVILPEGTYYRHDLIGCNVQLSDGLVLGDVIQVEGSSEGSRLVVRTGSEELLVPLVDHICVKIEPKAGVIVIDPPSGLLELNKTTK